VHEWVRIRPTFRKESLLESAAASEVHETVIRPRSRVNPLQTIRELWEHRELCWVFIARDVTVRYRQTALGVSWVILQPLMAGVVLAAVFHRAGVDRGSAIHGLTFFVSGLAPWSTFASAVNQATTSLERSADMLRKVYFPRMIVPCAHVVGSALDYVITLTLVYGLAFVVGGFNPLLLAMTPLLLLMQLAFAAGVSLFLSALNAQYHDIKYVVPLILNVGLFASVLIPYQAWGWPGRFLLSMSPMTAVIGTYRAVIFQRPLDDTILLNGLIISMVTLVAGAWFFRFREAQVADIL
jgi:lipopolysaccharide transport system permease protein